MLLKRPLFYISLFFVCGMYILSVVTLESVLMFSIFAMLVFVLILLKKINVANVVVLFLCVLSFCAGCIRYEVSNDITAKELYTYVGDTVQINAEITDTPVVTDKTVSFVAQVTSIDRNGKRVLCEGKMRFSHFIQTGTTIEELNIPYLGAEISVAGKITVPNGAMNTGGFDYSRYLKGENIFFQCEISLDDLEIIDYVDRPEHIWQKFRRKCISIFDEAFPSEEGGVLKAFVLGDKSSLSDEIGESFSASGLSHILAVSGLHVSVFSRTIGRILALFRKSKRKQMIASSIAGIFFVLFTGASVSAIRAGIMCVVAYFAKLIYRKADSLSVLAVVAAVFCVINPHVVYDASFILSFSATAGILMLTDSVAFLFKPITTKLDREKWLHCVIATGINIVCVGIAAQIFVTPLLVYMFNGFSVMSVIATVVINPLLSPMLLGGVVFTALSFVNTAVASPVGIAISLLSKIVIYVADLFGSFAFSKVIFGVITPFLLLMYASFVVTGIFAIRKKWMHFATALVCTTCLLITYLVSTLVNYNIVQVSFINVGNGDCALIKAPGDCDILIDAGGSAKSETSGEYIIAPYLIKNGVNDIEYVVLSHTHADHVNGLLGLFDIMEIGHIIMPYNAENTEEAEKILKKAKEYNIPITYFIHGDVLYVNDDIKITAITPDAKQYLISKDANDSCLTVRLDYGETSFLFTGDITSDIEGYILDCYPEMLEADVLKVAHHGSDSSSCQGFIDAVSPQYSYIPVGENSYGHPSQEVIERLLESGSQVYRANVHRDVTFYFDDKEIVGVKYKAAD